MPDTNLPRNTPFVVRVTAAATGDPATALRLYQNGAPVGALAPVNGVADFPFASGLPKGNYTFEGSAVNDDGESEKVSTILLVTGKPPDKPQSITIIL